MTGINFRSISALPCGGFGACSTAVARSIYVVQIKYHVFINSITNIWTNPGHPTVQRRVFGDFFYM